MNNETRLVGREAVEKFFSFYYDSSELKKAPASVGWIISGSIAGIFLGNAIGVNPLATGVVAGILTFSIDALVKATQLKSKLKEQRSNEAELARLAKETRETQGRDITRGFLRVFDRTLLDRSELRVLEQKYVLDAERDLFGDEPIENKFGDLVNKSIRLISKGEGQDTKFRKVFWRDQNENETFFNPLRMVCLFLAERQLVICDITIDSAGGDLKEEINRYSLAQIVSVSLQAERKRLNLSGDQIVQVARDLGYDERRIVEIEKIIKRDGEAADKQWAREESVSLLRLSRTDGGILQVPIRSELIFGQHSKALDQDEVLTKEEITIDRMVNELNRLVNSEYA